MRLLIDIVGRSLVEGAAVPVQRDVWFGRSVVRDADGAPLRCFHGTDATFTTFDRSFAGNGPSKFGFWFTDESGFAEMFGSTQMPVYLKIERPKVISGDRWNEIRDRHAKDGAWFAKWRDQLVAAGHDGLIVRGTDNTTMASYVPGRGIPAKDADVFAVFDANQIKSAERSGFSADQDDIHA